MASVQYDQSRDRWQIQVICPDRRRRSIYLPGVAEADARAIAKHVGRLAKSRKGKLILDDDDKTTLWLKSKQGKTLLPRLIKLGLGDVPKGVITLKEWVDGYLADRDDLKPASARLYDTTRKRLYAHFKENTAIEDITPAGVDAFRRYLARVGLSENTIRKRVCISKVIFRAAVRDRKISENPFAGQTTSTLVDEDDRLFVTREMTALLMAVLPDDEWRLIVALCRFGGLRCSSEIFALRLDDIHFDSRKIVVRSPKTERYPGKDKRVIPLFPELEGPLLQAAGDAQPGEVYVIHHRRYTGFYLRKWMYRFIEKAGLDLPTPFQCLRSSRETELSNHFPAHVVA